MGEWMVGRWMATWMGELRDRWVDNGIDKWMCGLVTELTKRWVNREIDSLMGMCKELEK